MRVVIGMLARRWKPRDIVAADITIRHDAQVDSSMGCNLLVR